MLILNCTKWAFFIDQLMLKYSRVNKMWEREKTVNYKTRKQVSFVAVYHEGLLRNT